jgi:hypothetical protein
VWSGVLCSHFSRTCDLPIGDLLPATGINRYVGRMVAVIATNPKIMPSKKPREDRHTPPHPLSITFMAACITKRFILRRYATFPPLENVIMYQTVCRGTLQRQL